VLLWRTFALLAEELAENVTKTAAGGTFRMGLTAPSATTAPVLFC